MKIPSFSSQGKINQLTRPKIALFYNKQIALYVPTLKEKDEMMTRLERLIEGK
ncbi:hypothetical protein H3Z82_06675 [Gelidibacter gilvus]|uniref:Uncharacterized protein n=1 Tax=Gelidibacter maritimus TaxID=2761487 RepID=A0A7W2M4Q3_9FLAO|nr:hypothetical protein [Gelidibacter maritimus]